MLAVLKALNLGLAFALELCMLAAFAYAASVLSPGWPGWVMAVAAVVVAAGLWGIWAAPKSARRLQPLPLLSFKIVLFGLATVALLVSAGAMPALLFAAVAALNLILAAAFGQT